MKYINPIGFRANSSTHGWCHTHEQELPLSLTSNDEKYNKIEVVLLCPHWWFTSRLKQHTQTYYRKSLLGCYIVWRIFRVVSVNEEVLLLLCCVFVIWGNGKGQLLLVWHYPYVEGLTLNPNRFWGEHKSCR